MLQQLTTPQLDQQERDEVEDVGDAIDGPAAVLHAIAELARAVTSSPAALVLLNGGVAAVGATSGALVLFTEQRGDLRLVEAIPRVPGVVQRERRFQLTDNFPL